MISDLVFDVGMCLGDDTAYYLHLGYRVIGVEANPVLAESLRVRFSREVDSGQLAIENVGIHEHAGRQPFYICDDAYEWSSFHESIASRDGSSHHSVDVETCSFASLLEKHGVPYFLKVDIEGNDMLCLDALNPATLPAYVSVESDMEGRFLQKLFSLGYRRFKCISQFEFLPIEWPPSEAVRAWTRYTRLLSSHGLLARTAQRTLLRLAMQREYGSSRRDGLWTFPREASGPFGERTLGTWHSYDDTVRTLDSYRAAFNQGQPSPFWTGKDYSFWFDIHAAL
jgi:FkbM family methyltransferase